MAIPTYTLLPANSLAGNDGLTRSLSTLSLRHASRHTASRHTATIAHGTIGHKEHNQVLQHRLPDTGIVGTGIVLQHTAQA